MESVLCLIFSNFYMSDLENRIFNTLKKTPIYLRYVDDILILANYINEINILQDTFQKNSVLNFTLELNKNNKLSFLDVLMILTIITSLPLLTKNPLVITYIYDGCPLGFKHNHLLCLLSSPRSCLNNVYWKLIRCLEVCWHFPVTGSIQ